MNGWPKIFQAWNSCDTALGEPLDNTIARHDLWWHVPEGFGVYWKDHEGKFIFPSLSGQFEPSTIANGLAKRAKLRALNPDIKLLVQIGYTEGSLENTDFPANHPWWLRDGKGNMIPGWGEGATRDYKFNLSLTEVRQHVADCAHAAIQTGVWDGIMLDVWADDTLHVDIIQRVRAFIGHQPLLICNGNYNIMPQSVSFMNGVFMECGPITSEAQWLKVIEAVDFNEAHVATPKVNCLESAYTQGGRNDFKGMRAITALSLTHTDGYALFADPNALPTGDHLHSWYRFWDRTLGNPKGKFYIDKDGMHKREYDNGLVVFNPPGNQNTVLNLTKEKMSVVSDVASMRFILESPDGGLYLNL